MINRTIYKEILDTINNKAVTVITGARQVGKTTLCSLLENDLKFNYVTLADPIIRNSAKNDPSEFLSLNPFPLIIDEIQKVPELFEYIEGIVDKEIKKGNKKGLYVLTGSQAYKLMKGVNESMSGRVGLIAMSPLSLNEINEKEETPFDVNIELIKAKTNNYIIDTRKMYDYIIRGFYPELYDNPNLKTSVFYSDYVETYIERDVSDFITLKDKQKFINLMSVLASLTGQELIYDNLAKVIGVDVKTINSWISVLIAGNIIYLLQPYNETSMIKQITKRPKIYFCDTGLACYLARVNTTDALISSYLKGHIVETFIINEIIKGYKNNRIDKETSFYYYRNSNQEEIDLIINRNGKLTLLECKSGEEFDAKDVKAFDNLTKTKLKIEDNAIICTTKTIYSIKKGIYVIPFTAI